MANGAVLALDGFLRARGGPSPLDGELGPPDALIAHVSAIAEVAQAFDLPQGWDVSTAGYGFAEQGLDPAALLEPTPLFDLVLPEGGDPWIGVPLLSNDDLFRIFDPELVAFEPSDRALVDGFVWWPVDGARTALLPSDADPGRWGVDLVSVRALAGDILRLDVATLAQRGAPLPVRHCHLDIHHNREAVSYLGICVDDEDEPCEQGCREVVRTVAGVALAVDCACRAGTDT